MANMFSHEGRIFKFDVLVQLARQAYEGDIDEAKIQAYCRNLVSMDTPRVRCCVYKEREILRQRVRLAMGKMADEAAEYNPRQIIQVIDAACDGCSIKKIRVTDNCRKCMAKACMASCNVPRSITASAKNAVPAQMPARTMRSLLLSVPASHTALYRRSIGMNTVLP